jgi:hypothetical protein
LFYIHYPYFSVSVIYQLEFWRKTCIGETLAACYRNFGLEDLERVNYAYALSNKECAAKEISKWKSLLEV